MTVWNPIWRVTIQGTIYTNFTLANLTITSGRTNIYEQANAGYVNMQLINLDQSVVNININDSVTIELKDSTATFTPIFGGTITDVSISVSSSGVVGINQTISIIALGALSRLPKALTDGTLASAHDGTQILHILQDLLLNNWSEVPAALTWATYNPTTTWANAENVGLGEIDTPGNYDLAARTADRTTVYSLVSALATSGLGYIYEDAQGRISYADSTHRSIYLATNGYTDLSAAQALSNGITIQTRAGDVRNSVTLKYGANSANETTPFEDADSIAIYGRLAQIVTTTLKNHADADTQAAFYLTLRAYPQPMFNQITYELTNPEIDNADRDSLINIFMGLPLRLSDLPLNMSAGTYLGFVEGWTFRAAYNSVSVTALLSPLAFSLQAMKWQEVSVLEKWNTISGTLEWQDATVVA
ncbi:hypothetical protein UFOVP1660_4 [uncultured Caudovirales phage]|uniref:Uncharacterized protein n=1 Tax=uncultured Caudovirales phage TaxID=2100421 RepID=A0A6J5T5E9_9CAUD|nr:hypothetical protein UFOVP1660_4 [uncultured Caudovirales phage]